MDAVNSNLANVEQVRSWLLLPREFSVGVELTPTFKIRRKVVAERYADLIEQLYKPKLGAGPPPEPELDAAGRQPLTSRRNSKVMSFAMETGSGTRPELAMTPIRICPA